MELVTGANHKIRFFAGQLISTEEVSHGYHSLLVEILARVLEGLTRSNAKAEAVKFLAVDCTTNKPLHSAFINPALTRVMNLGRHYGDSKSLRG